jgi:hypothetical protein
LIRTWLFLTNSAKRFCLRCDVYQLLFETA